MSDQAAAPAAPAAMPAATETPQTPVLETQTDETADSAEFADSAETKANPVDVKKAAKKVDAEKVPGTQKFVVTIDGVDEELTQDELIKYAQKSKAADKRFQESAQIKKEAAELIRMLRDSPERVLADPAILGSDEKVIELAQKILAKKIEEESKPQAVREKERLEKELQELREANKRNEEERKRQEYETMVKQHESQLEEQIQDAMESSGLPKSPYVLKRLADVMISSLEYDKEISPKQAMNIVKREMQKDLKEYFDASPEDMLEELLGSDNIKRLRKRQVAKIKAEQAAPTASQIKPAASAKAEPQKAQDKKIAMKDWLRSR